MNAGIDFGTSNSGVAVSDGHTIRLLPLDNRSRTPEVIRTILYVTRDFNFHIGQEAVDLYYQQNVGRLRRYVKQRVGEVEYRGADMFYVTDVYAYVDELTPGRLLQYLKTSLRTRGYTGTQIFDRYFSVSDLISRYLYELRTRAEAACGVALESVVLGRPVHFSADPKVDLSAQQTLHDAALAAGFKHVSFELEPVAAALSYERTLTRPQIVLVFDFGGGTLDLTIMRLGNPRHREVLATNGIDIAGSDFDRAIIRGRLLPYFGYGYVNDRPDLAELVNSVSDWMALPELSTPRIRARLSQAIAEGVAPVRLKALESLVFNDLAFSFFQAVESAKIELSSSGATVVALKEKGIDLWELYTRYQFEQDIDSEVRQIQALINQTVEQAGLEPAQIDAVVKTGGSSAIPCFHELLCNLFSANKVFSADAFSSVTAGLALRASELME